MALLRRKQLATSLEPAGAPPMVGEVAAVACLAAGDRELYFSRTEDGEQRLYVSKRDGPDGAFGAAAPVGFSSGFASPSLTADGSVMYLQGHSGDRRPRLYRARRKPDGGWATPVALRETRGLSKDAPSLDINPCISRDGSTLIFSSDRDGGAGGFDLWAMRVSPEVSATETISAVPKVAVKPPMKEKETKAAAKKPPKPPSLSTPIAGKIENWMWLGPLAEPKELGLAELKRQVPEGLHRRFPKAGESVRNSKAEWKRGGPPAVAGAYVFTLQFRSKARMNLQVAVDSAPGAAAIQLDKPETVCEVSDPDPWKAMPKAEAKGEAFDLLQGRHRLVALVCVADPSIPFVVRLLDADTGKPAEGLAAED
jgi:hypothetical protein